MQRRLVGVSDHLGPCGPCGAALPTREPGQDFVICTACGSKTYFRELYVADTAFASEGGKVDTPEGYRTSSGRRRPMVEFFSGRSYTHDDGSLAQRQWLLDRVRDIWHEVVIRANGQRMEKTESLRKHRGHGSDRRSG